MARPRKSVKFLSEGEVIAVNEEMVAKFGGLHGVRDLHILSSAIGRPQISVGFQDAYKSIFDKAAAMMHGFELAAFSREQLFWNKDMLAIKATVGNLADMKRIQGI